MRFLVTGGFGYIGGRLAHFISNQLQHQVVLGSRRYMSVPAWLPQAEVVQIDWESPDNLEDICSGIDVVIHCAGMNAQDCMKNPVAALEVNGIETAKLLQAAIRKDVRRFLYLSTAHVYANPLVGVFTESSCPTSLLPYATSHRAGENVVMAAHQHGEIEGLVARISNAYGVPVHRKVNCWMLLVNDLCYQAVTKRQLILNSSGLQRRDFVPMSAVCHAINLLLDISSNDIGNGVFNVGGGWSPTVWEMACLIQQRCETKLHFLPELIRKEPHNGEEPTELDFRANGLLKLGFQPATDKTSEIDELLEFCQSGFH